jgi:hypothetical protein
LSNIVFRISTPALSLTIDGVKGLWPP